MIDFGKNLKIKAADLLIQRRTVVDELLIQHRLVSESVKEEKMRLGGAELEILTVEESRTILQSIAQTLQQTAHGRIAGVVTRCLNAVFPDDPYGFEIRFERKRGKTEAAMVFTRNGMELDDPLNEVGGGVVDVASLALRLACVVLARPVRRRLLVLDEPFSHIRGEGNRCRTREMLERLSEELGIQFILCTDIEAYRTGTVVEVGDG